MPNCASLGTLSYTLEEYEQLLKSLRADGFSFRKFGRPLEQDDVVIRHDVDLSPAGALEMARVEASLDVQSTYCLLVTTPIYNLLEVEHSRALAEIQTLGHDVAVHFNTHHYWDERPSEDELRTQVRAECDVLGTIINRHVDTVSFHRPPEWVLDVDFDGFENAYQPAYFSAIEYRSDSRQKWRTEPPFPEGRPDRLQLLVHPGLWGNTPRKMADIVAELEAKQRTHVEAYLDGLGA
ncbi:hypothetical protein ACLI4Y_05885 [Natrialbaceae archaeon A-CW3]